MKNQKWDYEYSHLCTDARGGNRHLCNVCANSNREHLLCNCYEADNDFDPSIKKVIAHRIEIGSYTLLRLKDYNFVEEMGTSTISNKIKNITEKEMENEIP